MRNIVIITLCCCFIASSALANHEGFAQESDRAFTQEDVEVVEHLELLQHFEMLQDVEDEDFDLLENLEVITRIEDHPEEDQDAGEQDEYPHENL